MKLSKYNTLVPYHGNYIYYNSLSNKFIYLEKFLADTFIDFVQSGEIIDNLQNIHEDFYRELVKYDFVVDETVDEFEKLKELVAEVNENKEIYRLIINPTTNCNFSCWYCYEDHSAKKMDDETFRRIQLLLDKIVGNDHLKRLQLSFFGGEPLLYYKKVVFPLSKYAKGLADKCQIKLGIDITTNGYLVNEKIIREMSLFDLKSLQITLDGIKEIHDKTRYINASTGSYDVIVRNIKMIIALDISVVLRINYTEENIKGLEAILDDFNDLSSEEKSRITISMNKVWQETSHDLEKYLYDFTKVAIAKGFKFPDGILTDRVRNSCYADKINTAAINYNGNVYKCLARDFQEENREGILNEEGDIIWNEINQRRKRYKLTNIPCFSCSIHPICGGGCTQYGLENHKVNYCVNNFDQQKRNNIIVGIFESEYIHKAEKEVVDYL